MYVTRELIQAKALRFPVPLTELELTSRLALNQLK